MTIPIFALTESKPDHQLEDYFQSRNHTVHWLFDAARLRDALHHHDRAVFFLQESDRHDIYELCRELTLHGPLYSVILLLRGDTLDLRAAMRAGAIDALTAPTAEADLTRAITVALEEIRLKETKRPPATPTTDNKQGRVITICSTKGGVGKTTLTVNLAIAHAHQQQKVAVLDLDLQFGDVAIHFNLKPKRTLYEWIKEELETGHHDLDRLKLPYNDRIDMYPAPLRPEFSEVVTAQHVLELIEQLKHHYDIVLIDTSPLLVETGLMAMEAADELLLITTLELPTLKNSRLFLETLEGLGYHNKVKIILNRDGKVKGISPAAVENILEKPVYLRIPLDEKSVLLSVNEGTPVIQAFPRSPTSRSLHELAAKLNKTKR